MLSTGEVWMSFQKEQDTTVAVAVSTYVDMMNSDSTYVASVKICSSYTDWFPEVPCQWDCRASNHSRV